MMLIVELCALLEEREREKKTGDEITEIKVCVK